MSKSEPGEIAAMVASFEGESSVRFADPSWLIFLVFAVLPWIASRRRPRLSWPTLDGFQAPKSISWTVGLAFLPTLARAGAIACIVVGLARPQTAGEQIRISGRGVAIALVVDRSSSMKTTDFPSELGLLSRLDATKLILGQFLEARTDDLIGVVGFAGYPDTLAPPTLDHRFTWDAIRGIRPAGATDDGTDIGGAIAWALGMLRPAPTQRKVLILLTDGHHAPGATRSIDPTVAAEVAKGLGVTLHTVAVGRPPGPKVDSAPVAPPVKPGKPGDSPAEPPKAVPSPEGDGPDLDLLAKLAERGNGKAFVATDLAALGAIFEAIDALETSPIQGTIRTVYHERFVPWVVAALGLVAVDLTLSLGWLRRLP